MLVRDVASELALVGVGLETTDEGTRARLGGKVSLFQCGVRLPPAVGDFVVTRARMKGVLTALRTARREVARRVGNILVVCARDTTRLDDICGEMITVLDEGGSEGEEGSGQRRVVRLAGRGGRRRPVGESRLTRKASIPKPFAKQSSHVTPQTRQND